MPPAAAGVAFVSSTGVTNKLLTMILFSAHQGNPSETFLSTWCLPVLASTPEEGGQPVPSTATGLLPSAWRWSPRRAPDGLCLPQSADTGDPLHGRQPEGDQSMRAVIVAIGIAVAFTGIAVATHQAVLWLQYGFWPPIRFSEVWFALGGATPDMLRLPGADGIVATLLEQPLSVVLFLGGAAMAYFGAERAISPWTRF
jgi:hypothetical protein